MKKSRFTNGQIAFALKQAESGTPVEEVCRKLGISQQTFRWKKKLAGLGVEELRCLKSLEEENKRLKSLVAALSLDKQILQTYCQKSSEACSSSYGGRRSERSLQDQRAPRVQTDEARSIDLPL